MGWCSTLINATSNSRTWSSSGWNSDPGRTADIQRMKAPQNVAQVHEFLGLVTYMSPFIPNLSQQTATLHDLVKKDAEFIWTDSHNAAFEARSLSSVVKWSLRTSTHRLRVSSRSTPPAEDSAPFSFNTGSPSRLPASTLVIANSDTPTLNVRCTQSSSAARGSTCMSTKNRSFSSQTTNLSRWSTWRTLQQHRRDYRECMTLCYATGQDSRRCWPTPCQDNRVVSRRRSTLIYKCHSYSFKRRNYSRLERRHRLTMNCVRWEPSSWMDGQIANAT